MTRRNKQLQDKKHHRTVGAEDQRQGFTLRLGFTWEPFSLSSVYFLNDERKKKQDENDPTSEVKSVSRQGQI